MLCPDCGKGIIVTNHELGEAYCSACGLVVDQVFDYSMHWYGDKGTSYQKTSYTRAYKGLGTVDPNSLPRYKGMEVTEEEKVERNFSNASHTLHVIWGLWQVPTEIREECAINYRKMIKDGITHGRNTHAMAIAATFLVCEKYGVVRDINEITKTVDINHKNVLENIKAMRKASGIMTDYDILLNIDKCVVDIKLGADDLKCAYEMAKVLSNSPLILKRKKEVVAGAIICCIASDKVNRRKIALILKVSERSLRRYSALLQADIRKKIL